MNWVASVLGLLGGLRVWIQGLFTDGLAVCPSGIEGGGGIEDHGEGGGIEGGGVFGEETPVARHVCPDLAAPYDAIQTAIDAASYGDTLVLCCDSDFVGAHNRNLTFSQKKLVIRSECDDPSRCVIDCEGREVIPAFPEARRGFVFEAYDSVSVRGLTVYDGHAYHPET